MEQAVAETQQRVEAILRRSVRTALGAQVVVDQRPKLFSGCPIKRWQSCKDSVPGLSGRLRSVAITCAGWNLDLPSELAVASSFWDFG